MTEQKTRISDEETKKLQAYILDIMSILTVYAVNTTCATIF